MKLLTNNEKRRYFSSSENFFAGGQEFVKKCIDEKFKIIKEVKQSEAKIYKKRQDYAKKKHQTSNFDYIKTLVVVGAVGAVLMMGYKKFSDVQHTLKDKLHKQSNSLQNYNKQIDKVLSEDNPRVKEVSDIYNKQAISLSDLIKSVLKGFLSRGDNRFPIDEMKQNGFMEPMITTVSNVALYWTMLCSGLEWMADMFGINEPSLVQLQFGVFAALSNDTNAYFGNATGEKGFSIVRENVKGYNFIRLIQKNSEVIEPYLLSGASVNVNVLGNYISYLNEQQAYIDETITNGIYDTSKRRLEQKNNLEAAVIDIASIKGKKNTQFSSAGHKMLFESESAKGLSYGDDSPFPRFGSNHQLSFVDDMVVYVERYISNSYDDNLRKQWGDIKYYFRGAETGKLGGIAEYNQFHEDNDHKKQRVARWTVQNLLRFFAFVPLVAEHEVHSSIKSLEALQSLYYDFLTQKNIQDQVTSLSEIVSNQKKIVDKHVSLYENGIITFSDYLKKIKDDVIKMCNNIIKMYGSEDKKNGIVSYVSLEYELSRQQLDKLYDIVEIDKYINRLKRIVRGIRHIHASAISGVEIDTLYDGSQKENPNEENDKKPKKQKKVLIDINNWYEETGFKERKISDQKRDLGDYLGEEISSTISDDKHSSERLLQSLFQNANDLEHLIYNERIKREELLSLLKTSLEKYYKDYNVETDDEGHKKMVDYKIESKYKKQ